MKRKIINGMLLADAVLILVVGVYGVIQYEKVKGENHLVSERIVQAPIEEVWEIIADVGNYQNVTGPGIHRVDILQGSGQGMVRECADSQGNSWEELCTLWEPEHRFKFEVNTDREDYAYPFTKLSGLWQVDALGPATTRITMDFSYQFKNAFVSGLFMPFAMAKARADTEYIMDNWQRMAEQN
jgi:ribosome-associated toxin RatA of RatAB toxin-antitoxin module